jgi:hypothetical protein
MDKRGSEFVVHANRLKKSYDQGSWNPHIRTRPERRAEPMETNVQLKLIYLDPQLMSRESQFAEGSFDSTDNRTASDGNTGRS